MVSVLLTITSRSLTLIIEDNGKGFDPESIRSSSSGGLGIKGMRDRAALLGGTTEIESGKGKGTTIYIKVPLNED